MVGTELTKRRRYRTAPPHARKNKGQMCRLCIHLRGTILAPPQHESINEHWCRQWSRRQKTVDEVEMPKVKLNSHNIEHLLLPSTGPTVNSLPSKLRFRLTFISYANPVGRKTFVTGFNVQPSSFVSLLLCQTLWGEFFRLSLFVWPRYRSKSGVNGKTLPRYYPLISWNKRAQHFPYLSDLMVITTWPWCQRQRRSNKVYIQGL